MWEWKKEGAAPIMSERRVRALRQTRSERASIFERHNSGGGKVSEDKSMRGKGEGKNLRGTACQFVVDKLPKRTVAT